ncbi:MAG TPA: hypothetical protein VIN60_02540 [Anaerolineales bacterium]
MIYTYSDLDYLKLLTYNIAQLLALGEVNYMSEKHIQQILEIEKRAEELHEVAVHDAQQLPSLAEQDAQNILDQALSEAHAEARKLVSQAQAEEEVSRILAQAEEKNHQIETLAMSNFDRAVTYILDRVTGKA